MSLVQNGLDVALASACGAGRAALIPYLTAGYPTPEGFVDLAVSVLEAGADALEIGIPFSDPLLDGPSIQRSQQAALDAGVTPEMCLQFAGTIHDRIQKPLLFMGAFNPILAFGLTEFCLRAADAGITALVIPDLPVEEQAAMREAARTNGLHVIQLVAPTSTGDRLDRACGRASGFVYCISVSGVTGARVGVGATARPLVARVRGRTEVPVAVGFGIGTAEAVREVATFADAAIVGSALIDLVGSATDPRAAATEFIVALAAATSNPSMHP